MKLKNGVNVVWFDRVANDEFYSVLDEIKTEEDAEAFTKWFEEELGKVNV